MGSLLGFRMVGRLATGRYVRPRRELRAVLLIDMKNSTGVAERLGAVRFPELLNDFFRDVADAALECGAEVHKYVGDEVSLYSDIIRVGRTSLSIRIEAWRRSRDGDDCFKVTEATFTVVAIDDQRRPRPVPPAPSQSQS